MDPVCELFTLSEFMRRWSQGCSIHCDHCVTWSPDGVIPTAPIKGNPPHTDKAGFRVSYCNQTMAKPWTLPREAWTMNINAVEGAENDSYRFNPWRAPGSAPVVDPCGQVHAPRARPYSLPCGCSFPPLGMSLFPKNLNTTLRYIACKNNDIHNIRHSSLTVLNGRRVENLKRRLWEATRYLRILN